MSEKIKRLIAEFSRYLIIGGLAFIVDFGTLVLLNQYLLPDFAAKLYVSTAAGFIFGLIFNYIFSIIFVFRVSKDSQVGKTVRDFIIFSVVGTVGLGLTELGMYLGTALLQFNYMAVKVVVTGLVLIWNYLGRKFLIFNRG